MRRARSRRRIFACHRGPHIYNSWCLRPLDSPKMPASRDSAQEPPMLLNALFPTRDIGTDPAKIRNWAQAAEGLGYHCIEVADHVFGAAARGDWKPLYSEKDP